MEAPVKREITIENLFGKSIVIDAFNSIYQFLSIIKGKDGKPLMNRNREITSHISGLLYRNLLFLEKNIKPIYCFDGINKSKKIRWSNPKRNNFVRINKEIIVSSKKLLHYMGIPYVQGEAEGEAQCCHLVKEEQAFAVASQDYDCITFGGRNLIRNFNIRAKRKKGNTTIDVPIEYINTKKLLEYRAINLNQLIDISILIGNDFFCGIKGIGEKTALDLIRKNKRIENIFRLNLEKKDKSKFNSYDEFYEQVNKIRTIFKEPKINTTYEIKRKKPNLEKLKEFLVIEQDFDIIRTENVIKRLKKITESSKTQTTMSKYF